MSASDIEGVDNQTKRPITNVKMTINEYLEAGKSDNTRRLDKQAVKLFHSTIMALSEQDKSVIYKNIDEYSLEELPDILCKFLIVVAKEDGHTFSSNSLNAYVRCLSRHLRQRDVEPVDINVDVRFKKVFSVLKTRQCEAAAAGAGPGKKKAECLSAEDMGKLKDSPNFTRNTPRGLVTLSHYVLMTGFGCRARKECRNITNQDLVFGPTDEGSGLPTEIKLTERITKTRRGLHNEVRDLDGKIYLDLESPDTCQVRTIVEYQRRKTAKQLADDFPFLLTPKQSAVKEPTKEMYWYSSHPLGENTIGKLLKAACEAAGIVKH